MALPVNIFWFRRDLRLEDNTGLERALQQGLTVLPLFIFDRDILDSLDDPYDARVSFIHKRISILHQLLNARGSGLFTEYGFPLEVFNRITERFDVKNVFTNHDYEPYAIERDRKVATELSGKGIGFHSFKDHVIFEKKEVVKPDASPYLVFGPYASKWKQQFAQIEFPKAREASPVFLQQQGRLLDLEDIGFKKNPDTPGIEPAFDESLIRNYDRTRDFPAANGTSRLGVHLRFGTISIRSLVKEASRFSSKFLDELIWREFFQMILWHFPEVIKRSFKPGFDKIDWRNNEEEFRAWCEGRTGYPLVDAGMRELAATGFMHNRARMVTASFLVKHLLIDWRWGEAWFASRLLDYELASNNGNWQWVAGSGCDAAPYYRIFNPQIQQKKFDPDNEYLKRWIPEFGTSTYPSPLVEHSFARERYFELMKSIR